MVTVTVTSCQEYPSYSKKHKNFLAHVTIFRDGEFLQNISVVVSPFCGEYDYEGELLIDDDEPIQIAIGQYFADNNVDVGMVGR